jgi:hypothetical protein
MSELRASGMRADADRCVSLLLRLQGLRRAVEAAGRRLLRLLLLWIERLPAKAGRMLRER